MRMQLCIVRQGRVRLLVLAALGGVLTSDDGVSATLKELLNAKDAKEALSSPRKSRSLRKSGSARGELFPGHCLRLQVATHFFYFAKDAQQVASENFVNVGGAVTAIY